MMVAVYLGITVFHAEDRCFSLFLFWRAGGHRVGERFRGGVVE